MDEKISPDDSKGQLIVDELPSSSKIFSDSCEFVIPCCDNETQVPDEKKLPSQDDNINLKLFNENYREDDNLNPDFNNCHIGVPLTDETDFHLILGSRNKRKNLRKDAKENRMRGQEYLGFRRKDKTSTNFVIQDVPRAERSMGLRCSSIACLRFKNRLCSEMSEELREEIFKMFWKEWNWETKRNYVCSCIEKKPTKNITKKSGPSRRQFSLFYHLKINDQCYPVCKKMLLSTLGLTENEVRYWLENHHNDLAPSENMSSFDDMPSFECMSSFEDVSSTVAVRNIDVSDDRSDDDDPTNGEILDEQSEIAKQRKIKFLDEFLNSLPKLPSYYCQKSSDKLYLQTDIKSFTKLFELYEKKCQENDEGSLSRSQFESICMKKNVSVFVPRKDRCDTCVAYEQKQLSDEYYKFHLKRKQSARDEKNKDKDAAIRGECHTLCCDLMAVQPLPLLTTNAAYYKIKLAMHNFTVYNLKNHDVMTYWFDETEGTLCSSTFASCLVDYIIELLNDDPKPVIVFSDGCNSYKNEELANALLHLSMTTNIPITQKYLEKGHTQMETDLVHSSIERTFQNLDICLPSHYENLTKIERKNPFAYRTKLLKHDFFRDYSDTATMFYSSIQPGNSIGDPTLTDVRVLYYDPEGLIKYKLNFNEDFSDLPIQPKKINPITSFPYLHMQRLKISLGKWNDLQDLIPLMPNDAHWYFQNLPHYEGHKRKRNPKETNNEEKIRLQKISNKDNVKKQKKIC